VDLRQHPARRFDHSGELGFQHGQMTASLSTEQSFLATSLDHIHQQSLKDGSVVVTAAALGAVSRSRATFISIC
jgi:hypothetical protein